MAACIATALALVSLVTRWLGLPARLGTLIAVGTAICGNSAIAATGPAIGARDDEVSYAVGCVTLFGLFFTPVFYDARMFGRWAPALMLNPVAPILEGFSNVVVMHAAPPLPWLGYSAIVSLLTFVTALSVFHKLEPYFAESV